MSTASVLAAQNLELVRTVYSKEEAGCELHHVRDRRLFISYALKQIDLSRNSERAILREVMALNGLPFGVAPHCHRVFEGSGNVYILMDWVDGRTLTEQYPSPPRDRPDLVGRLRALLTIAHRVRDFHRKLYHRDLKPDNIILQNVRRGNPSAYVIDFGLAVQDRGHDEGTSGYSAPEQNIMRQTNITAATDIFGLGQVGWFLVAGYPRPLIENLPQTDWEWDDSPRPTVGDIVPRSLLSELDRATAFRPDDRHRNASEFASAISNALRQLDRPRRSRRPGRS